MLHRLHGLAAYNAQLFSTYFKKNILLQSSPRPQDVAKQINFAEHTGVLREMQKMGNWKRKLETENRNENTTS